MQMVLSRAVLITALSLFGYFAVNGMGTVPSAGRPVESEVDFAQLASQLTSSPTIPIVVHSDRDRSAPPASGAVQHASGDDCISLVPNPSVTQANLRVIARRIPASDLNPFQLLSPTITATTELIPGRWKARSQLLVETRQLAEHDSDPWISSLQTSQLELRIDSLVSPRDVSRPERSRSRRQ